MLEISKIKKSFSGVEVLHGISFRIEKGSVTAIVGENGAGKSTLMKILSGVYNNYEGEIFIDNKNTFFRDPREAKQNGVSIIHQELSCIPDISVAENIFIGKEPLRKFGLINYNKLYSDADNILKEFEFPYSSEMLVRNLSVGWQQIVEIAHAFSIDAKIFILDEPTSALTDHEIKILFDKIRVLKERGKIIIFISHRLDEIYEIADEIVVMRDGNLIGKYPSEKISRSELINKMVGDIKYLQKETKSFASSEMNLKVENLNVFNKTKNYLSNINFELKKGETLGISGLLGSGKSELLRFLFGELTASYTGAMWFEGVTFNPKSASASLNNYIFYLSKERKNEGIFPGLDIIKNSSISVLSNYSLFGYVNNTKEVGAVVNQVTNLNVKYKSYYQPIKELSGGNQQKVLLGRGLMHEPKLLLLDEPTRGIDIGAKEEIYNLIYKLSEQGISSIISSSEIPELLRICDKILVLYNGSPMAMLSVSKTNTKEILHYAMGEN